MVREAAPLPRGGSTGQTTGQCGRPVGWPVVQPVCLKDNGPDDGSAQMPRQSGQATEQR